MSIKWHNTALQTFYNGGVPSIGALTMKLISAISGTLDANSTIGQFTESTFPGYAQVGVGSPGTGSQNGEAWQYTYSPATFTPSGVSSPENCIGYILVDGMGSYKGGEIFGSSFSVGPGFPPFTITLTVGEKNQ